MKYLPAIMLCSVTAFCSFQEDHELWNTIDALNESLNVPGSISDTQIEGLFKQALETAVSIELQLQIESVREDAFLSGDYTAADAYISRAAPAITVIMAGESNNIGVNVRYFLEKAAPDGEASVFFDLASDGFYFNGENARPGTAELPMWMERAGSSAQASIEEDLSEIYLRIWEGFRVDFSGYFGEIADETIIGLGGEI